MTNLEMHKYESYRLALLEIEKELPDDLFDSKDWKSGGLIERIQWLKGRLEDRTQEVMLLTEMSTRRDERLMLLEELAYTREDLETR